jgi:hypothetical protein
MHKRTHCDLVHFEARHDVYGGCGHVRSKMLEVSAHDVLKAQTVPSDTADAYAIGREDGQLSRDAIITSLTLSRESRTRSTLTHMRST